MIAVLFFLADLDFLLQGHSGSPALGDEFLEGMGPLRHFFDLLNRVPHIGRIVVCGYLRERFVGQIIATTGTFYHHIEREFFIYY